MNYSLAWPNVLIRRLTALYLQARTDGVAREFTEAVARVEMLLQMDPNNQGESRDDGQRILVESPISVIYRIDEDNRRVVITGIGYSRGRR